MVWEELLRKHEDEQAAESSRRRNFMVVDGNPMIRRFVQVLADRRGYNCDQAASGSQCLQLSTLKEYSMIIIDYKMNGLYATMELKRKGYSGLIIGLIDPHQGSGSVQQFMDAGADSVIVTPFTARQLDKLISFMNELRSPSFSGRLQGDQGPLKEFEKAPNLLGGTSRSSDSPPKRSPHIVGEDTGGDDPSPQLLKKKPIKMSISTDETDAATTGLRQRVKSEMTNKSDT
jgi:CheY-like chemotaxis protein